MTPEERAKALVDILDLWGFVENERRRTFLERNIAAVIQEAIREAVKEERECCWDLCNEYAEEQSVLLCDEDYQEHHAAIIETARFLARRIREQP